MEHKNLHIGCKSGLWWQSGLNIDYDKNVQFLPSLFRKIVIFVCQNNVCTNIEKTTT